MCGGRSPRRLRDCGGYAEPPWVVGCQLEAHYDERYFRELVRGFLKGCLREVEARLDLELQELRIVEVHMAGGTVPVIIHFGTTEGSIVGSDCRRVFLEGGTCIPGAGERLLELANERKRGDDLVGPAVAF